MVPTFTVCIGLDKSHLEQWEITLPTWVRNKPTLFEHPFLIFYDDPRLELPIYRLLEKNGVMSRTRCQTVLWENLSAKVSGDQTYTKWNDPHRAHMLAGFVHVPGRLVNVSTDYVLKLDVDLVASHQPDLEPDAEWIDARWFEFSPAIVAHRWTFTKPPDQMLVLDQWVKDNESKLPWFWNTQPLNMVPVPNATKLGHARIISWCGFFRSDFVSMTSLMCFHTVGDAMPVASQDGFQWYVAKRLKYPIIRPDMKSLGWEHWGTTFNLKQSAQRALEGTKA